MDENYELYEPEKSQWQLHKIHVSYWSKWSIHRICQQEPEWSGWVKHTMTQKYFLWMKMATLCPRETIQWKLYKVQVPYMSKWWIRSKGKQEQEWMSTPTVKIATVMKNDTKITADTEIWRHICDTCAYAGYSCKHPATTCNVSKQYPIPPTTDMPLVAFSYPLVLLLPLHVTKLINKSNAEHIASHNWISDWNN